MEGTVLVADDDRTIRTVLTQALTRAGCRVRATGNIATLWRWIEEGEGQVVVTDVMMPDGNGLDLLPTIRRARPELPVIVISAQNTVVTAIRATELGAFEYLPKPFDLRDLLAKVKQALSRKPAAAAESPAPARSSLPLVGGSAAMQEVYRVVARVVNTDLNVLIQGEAGTGKTLLARALHALGHRAEAPLLTVTCGTATVESLSEVVTGEAAAGATICLDELADLSQEAQLQLLGLMQSDRLRQLGPRFISSTARPLARLVSEGLFREDLYYRLNVIPIQMPPLRARLDDIPELALHFLARVAEAGGPVRRFGRGALEKMRAARWAGNVRALENFVQRAAHLSPEEEISAIFVAGLLEEAEAGEAPDRPPVDDRLGASVEAHIRRYFELHGDQLPPPGLYDRVLREVELPLIALTLSATRGNQIRAAEILGINRNTLRKKIRDLDIEVTRTRKMM